MFTILSIAVPAKQAAEEDRLKFFRFFAILVSGSIKNFRSVEQGVINSRKLTYC